MRHLKKGKKFGRERDQRRALMKSLATAFFLHGRIETTEAKAKAMRPLVERYIQKAKNPTLATRRALHSHFSESIVLKVFEAAKSASSRIGGYTRIIRLGQRKSDGAARAIMELVK